MGNRIRVLVAGGEGPAAKALRKCLEREPEFDVQDHCTTGREAARLAAEWAPDVVLLDVLMSKPGAFEAARLIRQHGPASRLVFFCNEAQDAHLEQALGVQAQGFLCGSGAVAHASSAIREIVAGGAYFSEEIRSRLVVDLDGIRLAKPG